MYFLNFYIYCNSGGHWYKTKDIKSWNQYPQKCFEGNSAEYRGIYGTPLLIDCTLSEAMHAFFMRRSSTRASITSGLIYFCTTSFKGYENRPFCFQQLQARVGSFRSIRSNGLFVVFLETKKNNQGCTKNPPLPPEPYPCCV